MTRPSPQIRPLTGFRTLAFRALGIAGLALAALGAALPGLPSTPFLLLAVWAFGRGDPAWAERLRRHARFGPMIEAWETRRAIPAPAKGLAAVGMTGSWATLAATSQNILVIVGAAGGMLLVLAYVVSRPSA